MNGWEEAVVSPDVTVRDALSTLDRAGTKVLLVADSYRRLLGTVSDGDIRRALLKGQDLSSRVDAVMNTVPHSALTSDSGASILSMMRRDSLMQIPIVDADGIVLGLKTINDFLTSARRDNWVVVMAGGLGSRLRELTRSTPKPMLHVGPRPLLETIVMNCVDQGFTRIYIAVNYLAEQIQDHFGDGAAFGADIRYLVEEQRMGTAGALGLLPERPTLPIVVTNADVLTKQTFCTMVDAHDKGGADITIGVRDYEVQVPFGVIQADGGRVAGIVEKPVHRHTISAGMNVVSPDMLDLVPPGVFFDMPSLFMAAVDRGLAVRTFGVESYWLDVGQPHEYERANADFANLFA
ncbi:alcohol dehydrogenase [Sphingomonas sp. Leaf412]|uniref:nucleotidyltransferase family protein n=1 Tax=Sphingomonas sp. Leaf412 TaxID=1736370 RepID=UPI0006F1EA4F|nr:nucleotidyltransferase family protein [Sphingomonas sp. Leaf412]KQT31159.1 alcohol dehydrogenase [Sphingomonas sp. Leaf412]